MARKTYISLIGNPLSIDVVKGRVIHTFDFTGGLKHPVIRMPKYSTCDENEQKLLEGSPLFNKYFKIESIVEKKAEPVKEKGEPELEVKMVKNVKEGYKWLNVEYGIPQSKANTRGKIQESAKELGFEVVFES